MKMSAFQIFTYFEGLKSDPKNMAKAIALVVRLLTALPDETAKKFEAKIISIQQLEYNLDEIIETGQEMVKDFKPSDEVEIVGLDD